MAPLVGVAVVVVVIEVAVEVEVLGTWRHTYTCYGLDRLPLGFLRSLAGLKLVVTALRDGPYATMPPDWAPDFLTRS